MFVAIISAVVGFFAFLVLRFPKFRFFDTNFTRNFSENRNSEARKIATTSHVQQPRYPKNKQLDKYKGLYHQLHNLERYPILLPEARNVLLSLFAEALSQPKLRDNHGILEMATFDAQALSTFIRGEDEKISARLESYIKGRDNGACRELFQTLDEAKVWLKKRAPSKLVDGAWLGHLHKVTTPFGLRFVTKNAWQVMSEELGDGDLTKNHAAIYNNMLRSIGSRLPDADSAEFIDVDFGDEEDAEIWKGAVAQLLISLFPNEFLPEILGFNLHFECLTWDTVRASQELKELRLDNSYFLLHISIDNSDSGHAAMSLKMVIDYLQYVYAQEGDLALQQAWKGVQVGYLLSERFAGDHDAPPVAAPWVFNSFASKVAGVLKAKATVAAKLHCGSKVRLGSKKLSEWLDHCLLESGNGPAEFLTSLSNAKPWVCIGDSGRSRLVKECEWNGKMFGAFTERELDVLKNWIDELAEAPPPLEPSVYWNFVGRAAVRPEIALRDNDVLAGRPVFSAHGLTCPWNEEAPRRLVLSAEPGRWVPGSVVLVSRLLPLWFTHPCLLESFVCIPMRTCNTSAGSVLRVLRSQRGFAAGGQGVGGMDEVRRGQGTGLVEIGLEMARNTGLSPPRSLEDVLGPLLQSGGPDSDSFAIDMLHWSHRPVQHRDALLGMAWAFVELHENLAANDCGLLSEKTRGALGGIAEREREGLGVCRAELSEHQERAAEFEAAARFARERIAKCFA